MDRVYVGPMSSALRRSWRTLAIERGGAIAVTGAVLYVWLACPYVTENDTAEFATLGALGGIFRAAIVGKAEAPPFADHQWHLAPVEKWVAHHEGKSGRAFHFSPH